MSPLLPKYYGYAIKFATIPRFICCAVFLGFIAFYYNGIPPTDRQITKRFKEQRQYYNRIRDMLNEDKRLAYLSRRDAQMVDALETIQIPSADISERRAQEYRDILDRTGSIYALRRDDAGEGLCLMAWRWGFGDSHHVIICWAAAKDSITGPYIINTRPNGGGESITNLDGGWYIVRD